MSAPGEGEQRARADRRSELLWLVAWAALLTTLAVALIAAALARF